MHHYKILHSKTIDVLYHIDSSSLRQCTAIGNHACACEKGGRKVMYGSYDQVTAVGLTTGQAICLPKTFKVFPSFRKDDLVHKVHWSKGNIFIWWMRVPKNALVTLYTLPTTYRTLGGCVSAFHPQHWPHILAIMWSAGMTQLTTPIIFLYTMHHLHSKTIHVL